MVIQLKNYRINEKGVVLVYVAILLVVFLGIAAVAVDVGYLMVGRTELQRTADAAALAATRQLGVIYEGMSNNMQGAYKPSSGDTDLIQGAAINVAKENLAAGKKSTLRSADIEIGTWNPSAPAEDRFAKLVLTASPYNPPDAVRVTARRDDLADGRISTFFFPAFAWLLSLWNHEPVDPNAGQMPVSATATAALSGPSEVGEGKLKTPFGLSENVFPNNCKDIIDFRTSKINCAGWHNFFDPINASAESDKLLGFIQGDKTCAECRSGIDDSLLRGPDWLKTNFDIKKTPASATTPATGLDDQYQFQGGVISSLLNGGALDPATYNGNTGTVIGNAKAPAPFQALFDYFRYRDGDGDNTIWTATVPVYADNDGSCINPNKPLTIVGFAKIIVKNPSPSPATIDVLVDCNFHVISGRSGGGQYGNLKGSIPNLVN